MPVVWCPRINEFEKLVPPLLASDNPFISVAPPPLASSQATAAPAPPDVNTCPSVP